MVYYAPVTSEITAAAQSLPIATEKTSNAMLHCKGTFAGVNCTFEGSVDDGDTWITLLAQRTSDGTLESTTGVLAAAPAYAWRISTLGLTHIRIRSTAWTSGTQVWTITLNDQAIEPTPSATISGTVLAIVVSSQPATGTNYNVTTTASTNAAVIKASAGSLYEITVANVTATATYVKLYNKATAPTVGTDVPVLTIAAAANTTVSLPLGALGKAFTTGIGIAATAAIGDSDTGVAVAGVHINATFV